MSIFPTAKIAPLLRGLLDPEGKGQPSAEEEAVIEKVEQSVARYSADDAA